MSWKSSWHSNPPTLPSKVNLQVIGDEAFDEFLEKLFGDLENISLGLSDAAAGELQQSSAMFSLSSFFNSIHFHFFLPLALITMLPLFAWYVI